jgi:hypothetical protein
MVEASAALAPFEGAFAAAGLRLGQSSNIMGVQWGKRGGWSAVEQRAPLAEQLAVMAGIGQQLCHQFRLGLVLIEYGAADSWFLTLLRSFRRF